MTKWLSTMHGYRGLKFNGQICRANMTDCTRTFAAGIRQ